MIINTALSTRPLMRVYPRRLLEDSTPLRPPQEQGVDEIAAVRLQIRADQEDPAQVIDYSKILRKRKRAGEPPQEEQPEKKTGDAAKRGIDGRELPEEKKQETRELERRDQEVRTHEQAHLSAAGGHARGGMSLEYQMGPNGQQYAVGGHVNIDSSEESTPEQTIAKMQTVRRAALAPAQPSSQDMAVAQRASAREQASRKELQDQKAEKANDESPGETTVEAERDDNRIDSDAREEGGMNAAAVKRGLQAYKRAGGPAVERTARAVTMAV